jgi:UDP-glucose 4-epimerase
MDLAKKIIKITQSKSKIITLSYSEAYPKGFEDMQRRVPDLSKIKSVLGWQPEIDLDQIIKDVIVFNTNK